MKLIRESVEDVKFLTEEKEGKEPEYYIEGIFLQANIKNRNGRIYPLEVMQKEVERYKHDYVDTKRSYGELGHGAPDRPFNIDFDRVSHIITDIWQDGNFFKARAKILDTPCGKTVKALIREGCQLGVSSRGIGSTINKDGNIVVDKFKLVTAGDIVWEPSAQTAFPQAVIEEEWEYNEDTGEFYKEEFKTLTAKEKSALQISEFKEFLNSLNNK